MTKFQQLCKHIQSLRLESQIKSMERSIDMDITISDDDKKDLFFLLELQQSFLPDINVSAQSMTAYDWSRKCINVFNN